ncbi:hypothetical protein N0V93_010353 [Gnomoniopsis smithogilvyi]|uniref:Uncharacterized protein n=1 Tax=Gnomoniopsis smithogilvyi TaxID=1191159 RepID=A0A9W9CSM4_9PEZI|nr:hypothetical protein N0V93_010353 [Gnomoniopsis smithogilvyi]
MEDLVLTYNDNTFGQVTALLGWHLQNLATHMLPAENNEPNSKRQGATQKSKELPLKYRSVHGPPDAIPDADDLAQILELYLSPAFESARKKRDEPYWIDNLGCYEILSDLGYNRIYCDRTMFHHEYFPSWQRLIQMNHPRGDRIRYGEGRGILTFDLHNIREAIGSLCTEIHTVVHDQLKDKFLPEAHVFLQHMRGAYFDSGNEGHNNEQHGFVPLPQWVIEDAELILKDIEKVLRLPWKRDCTNTLDTLREIVYMLETEGKTLATARQAGWYLSDRELPQHLGGNRYSYDNNLHRIFVGSRQEIADTARSAANQLIGSTWESRSRLWGNWREPEINPER